MSEAEWFRAQLLTGLDLFERAIEQVPESRRCDLPPDGAGEAALGDRTAAHHVFHLLFQERTGSLPLLAWWAGGPQAGYRGPTEEDAWSEDATVEQLLAELRALRREQADLVAAIEPSGWDEVRSTPWGDATLRWIMTRTLQHTHEHTHDVLSLGLYWGWIESRLAGTDVSARGAPRGVT